MEFDDLITLILFLAFFVLPSILRGLGKKKKKPVRPKKAKKKRFPLFGKLGEALREFSRELERQALEAKRKAEAEKSGRVWEEMAEEEIEIVLPEDRPATVPAEKRAAEPYIAEPVASPRKKPAKPASAPAAAGPGAAAIEGLPTFQGALPRNPLQQAVVWSEILGKPVALRDD
ncbi:MAG: hypothetical protein HUN04_13295 [Desulfobacter sp.]|nr:MAG: hypothetical protein HUN04_13295 [Desulfobacter sp.]